MRAAPSAITSATLVAVLFAAGSLVLHPPLPIVMGLEFGLMAFLGWRELDRSVGRGVGQIVA